MEDRPECSAPQLSQAGKAAAFQKDVEHLINRHSLEGIFGDTPDFILAQYVTDCLWNFN